jgi:hypothetical protein
MCVPLSYVFKHLLFIFLHSNTRRLLTLWEVEGMTDISRMQGEVVIQGQQNNPFKIYKSSGVCNKFNLPSRGN